MALEQRKSDGNALRGEGLGVNIDKLIVLSEVRTKLSLDHEEAKQTQGGGYQSRQGRFRFLLGRAGTEQQLTATTASF